MLAVRFAALRSLAVVAAAAALTWGGRRLASRAFGLLAVTTGWVACVVGIIALIYIKLFGASAPGAEGEGR